jgi:hypothetical protein
VDRTVVDSLVLRVYNDGVEVQHRLLGLAVGVQAEHLTPLDDEGDAYLRLQAMVPLQGSPHVPCAEVHRDYPRVARPEQVTAAHVRYKDGPAHLVDGEVLLE